MEKTKKQERNKELKEKYNLYLFSVKVAAKVKKALFKDTKKVETFKNVGFGI